MPNKTREGEAQYRAMEQVYPTAWVSRLTDCLAQAGCPQPAETAEALRRIVAGANNAATDATEPGGLLASTFTERMNNTELGAFTQAFNAGLLADALHLIHAFPPDGLVLPIADVHTEDYYSTWTSMGKIPAIKRRATWRVRSTANNKKTHHGNGFLFVILVWESGGQTWRYPVHISPVHPLEQAPLKQMERVLDVLGKVRSSLKKTKAELGPLLADRYYNALDVHQALYDAGFRAGIRMQNNRSVYDPKTGQKLKLRDLLQELATSNRPPKVREINDDAQRRGKRPVLTKECVRPAALWPKGPVYSIYLEAGLQRVDTKNGPKLMLDLDMSMILCFPADMDASTCLELYKRRWGIETYFAITAEDRPAPRSQTINSLVVQYFAYTYRMCIGLVGKNRLAIACPSGYFRRLPMARHSIKNLSRKFLGILRRYTPLRPEPPADPSPG